MKQDQVRRSLKALRYMPFVAFFLMLIHVAALLIGIDVTHSEICVVVIGFYLIHTFSITFDYCLIHRLMIYYTYIIFVCIWSRRFFDGPNGLFGEYILHARIIAMVLGLIILALVAYRRISCHKSKK